MFNSLKKWFAELRDAPVDWDELEAALVQSDLGIKLACRILDRLKEKPLTASTIQHAVEEEILSLWPKPVRPLKLQPGTMNVWMFVGANGTGKTTTIAKLAHRFEKHRPFLIAADTFRAAAIEQLHIWAERTQTPIHAGKEGGDPSAAVYEGLDSAQKTGAGLVLIDTAGRLHNKENLMRELEKIKRVAAKKNPSFPHETLLVVDGMNGLNALNQAKEFHQAVGVTGIIATKLESTAKGGVISAIKNDLGLDTLFTGTGETLENLEPFDPRAYAKELI